MQEGVAPVSGVPATTANDDGFFFEGIGSEGNTEYRARFATGRALRSSTSEAVRVDVKVGVFAPTPEKRVVTISGQVSPAHEGRWLSMVAG